MAADGSNRGRRFAGVILTVAAMVLVLLALPARAQWWGGGMMESGMERPPIARRDLKEYGRILGLSEAQQRAAEELLGVYDTEYRAAVRRMDEIGRAMQEEVQQTGDWEIWQRVLPEAMRKFYRRIDALNVGLLDDVKAILTDPQMQQWQTIERRHRRKTLMRYGWLGNEKVDVVGVVEGLRLDSTTGALADALNQYETDLDRELVAMQRLIKEQLEQSLMNAEGKFDEARVEKLFKEMRDAGRRIGSVNQRAARQVEQALSGADQARFRREVRLQMYPAVYRTSYAMRVLQAAIELDDLDASQREAIKGLQESYDRDAGAANERWSGLIQEIESGDSEEAMGGWWGGYNDNPKVQEARAARKAIDDRTVDAVKAILTEAQRKKLPDPNNRPEFDFDAPNPDPDR
jgi:hypothetical protein